MGWRPAAPYDGRQKWARGPSYGVTADTHGPGGHPTTVRRDDNPLARARGGG